MKYIYLFTILCLPFVAGAQSWSSLPVGDSLYYLAPDSTMHALFAEDVVADPVGFNRLVLMKGLEEDSICLTSYLGLGIVGEMPTKPLWSGGEALVYPNGLNSFFNKDTLAINIETLAGHLDTWVFFEDAQGNYLEATIVSLRTAMVKGAMDSIKVIKLSAIEVNAPISSSLSQWNNEELTLSKNNGLVQIPLLLEFPMRKTVWSATTLKPLTYGEVYGHNIGDEFQIETYRWSDRTDFNYYLVLDKEFNIDSTEVTFTYYHERYSIIGAPYTTGYDSATDTIVRTYMHLKDFVVGAFPDKFYYNMLYSNREGTGAMYIDTAGVLKGKRITKENKIWDTGSDTLGCVFFTGGDAELREYYHYVEGIGKLRQLQDMYFEEIVVFYSIGGQTAGRKYTAIEEFDQLQAKVYPNPANNFVSIFFPQAMDATVKLINTQGKIVAEQVIVQSATVNIPVSNLSSGIYILHISNATGTSIKRIMVQH